jgi:hypothetical protein
MTIAPIKPLNAGPVPIIPQNRFSFLQHALPLQTTPSQTSFTPQPALVDPARSLQNTPPATQSPPVQRKVEWGDTIYSYWREAGGRNQTGLDATDYQKEFNELNNQATGSDSLYEGETVFLPFPEADTKLQEQANLQLKSFEDAKMFLNPEPHAKDTALEHVALDMALKDLRPDEARQAYQSLRQAQSNTESPAEVEREVKRLTKDLKELKVTTTAGLFGGLIGITSSINYIGENRLKNPLVAFREVPTFIRGLGDMAKAIPWAKNTIQSSNLGSVFLNHVTPATYSAYAGLSAVDIGLRFKADAQNNQLTPRKKFDYALESASLAFSTKVMTWDVGWSPFYQTAKKIGTAELIKHWSSAFTKLSIADAALSTIKAIEVSYNPETSVQEARIHQREAIAHSVDAGIYATGNPFVILGSKLANVAFAQTLPDRTSLRYAFQVEQLPLDRAAEITLDNGKTVLASDSLSGISAGLGTQALWKTLADKGLNTLADGDEQDVRAHYRQAAMDYQARAVALRLFEAEKRTGHITSREEMREEVHGLGFVNPSAKPRDEIVQYTSHASPLKRHARRVPEKNISLADQALMEQSTDLLKTMRRELETISAQDLADLTEETPFIRSKGRTSWQRTGQAFENMKKSISQRFTEALAFSHL